MENKKEWYFVIGVGLTTAVRFMPKGWELFFHGVVLAGSLFMGVHELFHAGRNYERRMKQ